MKNTKKAATKRSKKTTKTVKRSAAKVAKKAPTKKVAAAVRTQRVTKKKVKGTAKDFFTTGRRGARGVERIPLHVLITLEDRARLVKLSHKMKLNGAELVRALIKAAKL